MGSIYENLEGHEGYGMRRPPDGTTTSSSTAETATFTSYVEACECDWRGGDHAPTERSISFTKVARGSRPEEAGSPAGMVAADIE